MTDETMKVLFLNRGIQEIMESPPVEGVRLPGDPARLVPSEDRPESRLDRILRNPSLDDRLLLSLKPDIREKDILAPERYRQVLGDAAREMRELLKKGRGRKDGDSLEETLALLEEHEELMDLLFTYRNLLHKG